jgi:hypothetical protein
MMHFIHNLFYHNALSLNAQTYTFEDEEKKMKIMIITRNSWGALK